MGSKCLFLKKPVETLLLAQTKRSLFVDFATKCPVMSELLTNEIDQNPGGKCPFSSGKISSLLSNMTRNMVHTSASESAPPAASEASAMPSESSGKCPFSNGEQKTLLGETNQGTRPDSVQESSSTSNMPSKCPFKMGTLPASVSRIVNDEIMTESSVAKEEGPITRAVLSEMTEPDPANQAPVNVTESTFFDYESHFDGMIQQKKDDHSYRYFRKVNRQAKDFPMGQDFTYPGEPSGVEVWCSNDYLGMSRHGDVINAAKSIIDMNGVGAGGTRNISGTSVYHGMLEDSLAKWHKKEAGLVFTSCYVANDTALYTLGQKLPNCQIFSDAGNHASMIHGIKTSGAQKVIFRHNDPAHLEEVLAKSDPNVPKIVAFETVHSMSGAICPLEELCDVAHKYGALTFVDEVHAVGLYGEKGAGVGERDGCLHKMDIISGTLGKAIGSIGGYLVGSASLIDTLRSYGSGFIFTTALPPAQVGAALTSVAILKSEEGKQLRKRHQENAKLLRTKLVKQGLPVEFSPSHIVPVIVGDPNKCLQLSTYLQQAHGIYIQAINYPTVPKGQEKLRIAPTPFHTEDMMDDLVKALKQGWLMYDLPLVRPVCFASCGCQYLCHQHDGHFTDKVRELLTK